MASTTFVDFVTPVPAAWLNDVNTSTYVTVPALVSSVGTFKIVSSIAQVRLLIKTATSNVFVTGYYTAHDGGGGPYQFDATDVTSVDNGGTIIVAADGGRWKLQHTYAVTALQFGAVADAGTTDNSTTLSNIQAWVALAPSTNKIVFPAGNYGYSISPNWAVSNANVINDGQVVFTYSGVGNAIVIDAGVGNNVTNMVFGTGGGFVVQAPGTAQNGWFVRNMFKSVLVGRCWGAGSGSAGFNILGCVDTFFDITTGNTELPGGFYLGAKPSSGVTITQSAAGHQTAYCRFHIAVDSCTTGIFVDSTLGNVFIGGYSEFNTSIGLQLTSLAFNNKFEGMDLEQNTVNDVSCAGSYNEFRVDTGSGGASGGFRFTGGVGNRLIGGEHDQVAVDAGTGNFIGGIITQRGLSGNLQVLDNGTQTNFGWYWKAQQQIWERGPVVTTTLTVTASPFAYTNNTGRVQWAAVTGGTVGNITITRNAVNVGVLGSTNQYFPLQPGTTVTVTYSSLPAMTTTTE